MSRESRNSRRSSERSSKFKYNKRSSESMEKRKRLTGFRDHFLDGTFSQFKPVENKENNLRLLPPTWEDAEHYGLDIYVHYQIGADKAAYLCLDKMKGEDCPICEERQEAHNSGDEELSKELRPRHIFLVLIIDRNNEKEGPQIWTMPLTSIEGELLYKSKDRDSGDYLYLDNPEEGYDFYFTRKGTGLNTEYKGVDIARKSSALGSSSKMDEWLKEITEKPIPECLVYFEYEHIDKAFSGRSEKTSDTRKDEEDNIGDKDNEDTVDYTYDEIMECRLRKLEGIAEDIDISDEDIDDLSEDDLRKLVCKKLDLQDKANDADSEDNEDKDDDKDARLNKARKKYSSKNTSRR